MKTSSADNIFLFTSEYPYGASELSLLANEITTLSQNFSKVYLLPLRSEQNGLKAVLPENVFVLKIPNDNHSKKKTLRGYLFGITVIIRELYGRKDFKVLKNFRYHLSEAIHYLNKAKDLKGIILKYVKSERDIFYTYWFDEWTTILSVLMKELRFSNKFVSRAHGFDLYHFRNKQNYIFPRYFQFDHIHTVFAISKHGESYLKSCFPDYRLKIKYSPLGTLKEKDTMQSANNGKLVVVSCSSVIELKRVQKIADILSHSKKQIQWIHFGNGSLIANLKNKCEELPKNVEVILKGHVDNNEVKKFYEENFVNYFINVSKYEGVPVSMMEAISFGIPIIATNVGGVSEIVNITTGVLIPEDFNPSSVCQIIEELVFSDDARLAISQYWHTHYSACTNYAAFCKQLLQ